MFIPRLEGMCGSDALEIMFNAQDAALVATSNVPKNAARIELFWLTFNREMRRLLERWVRVSADI